MKTRLDSVIKSLSTTNAAIKNTASPVEKEGWFPTFSASGQDVWLPEYRFDLSGIVVSAVGARCGKAFKADGKWNVCANTHALSVDESIADRDYCWYMLNNENWWVKGGTAQPFVKVKDSLKREHFFPTLSEQRKIVKQLDQINRVIELRREEIASLDDLIKARFVEMFGDPTSNSKGWVTKRFDSICDNLDNQRKPITASERKHGFYPYYGASGIVDYVADYIFDENLLLISEDGANLVMRTTPIAFSVSGKVWVNNHAHVVRFNDFGLQKYIEIFFSMIDISDQITGSAQPKLNQAKLNAMMFPIPNKDLTDLFLSFVQQVDKSR